MKCPIRSDHDMVEVAPGLFQCERCGYGPSQHGYRPFWALSGVEERSGVIDAICVRWDDKLDCYVMSDVSWYVAQNGRPVPQTFEEAGVVYLSTKEELDATALPIIIRAKSKWDFPPAKPKLRQMMYQSPLGPKEIALASAR